MKTRLFMAAVFCLGLLALLKGCTSGDNTGNSFGSGSWAGNPAADSMNVSGGRFSGTLFGTVINQQSQRVEGAVVTVSRSGTALSSMITGSDGTFQISLATGTYEVKVAKTGYADFSGTTEIQAEVKTIFNVEMSPKFTFSGTVKLDSSSEALTNIPVDLFREAVNLTSTITTAEGKFIFQDLSAGQYTVTIASGSNTYASKTYGIQILKDGTISPKVTDFYISLNLESDRMRYSVSGTVRDAFSKAPIEYATCNIKGFGSVLSDSQGVFYFTNLFDGQYQITFTKNGFNDMTANFYLSDQGETNPAALAYELVYTVEKNMGSISGRYVDEATGSGVNDLVVRVYQYLQTQKEYTVQITDPDTGSSTFQTQRESNWEFESLSPQPVKSTHTSADIATVENSGGSFKITHLSPTTDTKKYFVYIGRNNSSVTTTTLSKGVAGQVVATWNVENAGNANKVHSWQEVTVTANTTTYLTNYEKEYK
jgi:hypothetical protein